MAGPFEAASPQPKGLTAVLVAVMVVAGGVLVFTVYTINLPPSGRIAFTENGLPSGTNWSVQVQNGSGTGFGPTYYAIVGQGASTITFNETNGNYVYIVEQVPGYVSSPESGSVAVHGLTARIGVSFVLITNIAGVLYNPGPAIEGYCQGNSSGQPGGCGSGDYIYYSYTSEAPTIPIADVSLTVTTANGTNYTEPSGGGGFALLSFNWSLMAAISSAEMGGHLWMSDGWQAYGSSFGSSSVIPDGAIIWINIGDANDCLAGLELVVHGVGTFHGATPPLALTPATVC